MRDTAPTPSESGERRHAERRIDRRVLVAALVISFAVHIAILRLVSFRLDLEPDGGSAPQLVMPERIMRAYDIAPVAADVAPIEAQVRERQALLEIPAADLPFGLTPPVAPADAAAAETGTALRDPLRYRMGSTEVWRPQTPLPADALSPDERVRARVAATLKEYNDSLAEETAARARALDWTVKDGDGGKWGISPGAIHLGGITLPLPIELGSQAEIAARTRTWKEFQDQAARVEVRDVFNERVRAIRERNDKERARQNAVTGGSGGGTTGGSTGGGTSGGGGGTGGGTTGG
ncbi:hypothetical protein BH23GEM9_BH23GEM9_10090 [soil metagenome]